MPVLIQTVCDGCGAVKKEANHWYTLEVVGTSEAKIQPMGPCPATLGAQHLRYGSAVLRFQSSRK
jgi:hypothetical protein